MSRNFQLKDLVDEALKAPFVWGQDDCLLFAADASQTQTDFDPVPALRGRWASKREAYEIILQNGTDLLSCLTKLFAEAGHVVIDPDDARPGDLAVLEEGGTQTTACRIEQGWLVRNQQGISLRHHVLRAWRVRNAQAAR